MAEFNPDAYLAAPKSGGFDPDAYLKGGMGPMVNKPAPADLPKQPYKGAVLPFSSDPQGNVSFDSDAGILGPIKRAIMAPGEAMQGKFDPMSREGIGRALEMASVISPVSAAMQAGEKAIPGVATAYAKSSPKVPTAPELKAAANLAYDKVRNSGVEYAGQSVQQMVRGLKDTLTQKAAIAENYPKTYRLLDQLDNAPRGSSVQLKFLDELRKELGRVAGGEESFAAKQAIRHIDDFIDAADPASLMVRAASGERALPSPGAVGAQDAAQTAAQTIRDARGNAAAGFRSNAVSGIEDAAQLRAAAANSGKNLGNTLRQKLASLLLDEDAIRGFSPQEIEAATKIVTGSPAANITRDVGNLLGGGGGLAQTLVASIGAGAGGTAGGPVGAMIGAAAPAAIGRGARGVSNALTKSEVTALGELMRQRSPLYQDMLKNAPMEFVTPDKRAALIRALGASTFFEDTQK